MSPSPACVCHVPMPCSNSDIYWQQHWSLYANADCGWTPVSFRRLCVFGMLIYDPSLPLSSITTAVHIVCVTAEIHWTELYFLFHREWWHLPEAGAVHLQHCLGDLSSRSGMYGSLPPQQVSDASENHISSVCPRLCKKSTLLSWHGAQWNSKCESARGCFSKATNLNSVGCIWDRYSCKIYLQSGFSKQVCHKMLHTKTKYADMARAGASSNTVDPKCMCTCVRQDKRVSWQLKSRPPKSIMHGVEEGGKRNVEEKVMAESIYSFSGSEWMLCRLN